MLVGRNISKAYGEHHALARISLSFPHGELAAIVGGNGAGKSTLLNILGGVVRPSTGGVTVRDTAVRDVRSARAAGIGFSHQDSSLVPDWTVYDCFAGVGVKAWTWIAPDVGGGARIHGLSAYDRQCLEIARAISEASSVILTDEPTALLGSLDKTKVYERLSSEARAGKSVLWVTHDLEGALHYAQRIVILREGQLVRDARTSTLSLANVLADLGVNGGTAAATSIPAWAAAPEISRLSVRLGSEEIRVSTGEIVGIAGSGRSRARDVLRSAIGLDRRHAQLTSLDGTAIKGDTAARVSQGLVYMSRERAAEWVFERQTVAFNIGGGAFPKIGSPLALSDNDVKRFAQHWADLCGVKAPSLGAMIEALSGGNRQKTVLARLMAMAPKFLLLDEPFSGVDRPTRHRLFELLRDIAANGAGIIIYSQETPDLIAATDRLCVLTSGGLKEFRAGEADHAMIEHAFSQDWAT